MNLHLDARQPAQRAIDLRRGRSPDVRILACGTYDFLLSLHVVLASPDTDYADYDVGHAWIESARERCATVNPDVLATLGRYLGDGKPGSLHATLISMVAQCPEPRETQQFLAWLRTVPALDLAEALLDQEGLGSDWQALLEQALVVGQGEHQAVATLVSRYPADLRETVEDVVRRPEDARAALIDALEVWDAAVFSHERDHVIQAIERDAETLERQRREMPHDRFMQFAMHGVEWQRPAGLRSIVFAPSAFCGPAVFYHFWRGTLTFCYPVQSAPFQAESPGRDPRAPSDQTLRFFEALGDQTRLRILRLLSEREMYLTELADHLGLTKATTKHHMVRLRASGMVTLYDRDRMTYYAINSGVARHAGQLLDEYLGRGSGA